MKQVLIRLQLTVVSIVLLITMGLTLVLVMRFNRRWDFTREKIYSLSPSTLELLNLMQGNKIEVLAFYPHEDPARGNFEIFLKECNLHHPNFSYNFYDPDRSPHLAGRLEIKEFYTVLVRYQDRVERIVGPTEENFTNALLRLANPKRYTLCFLTGHGEALLSSQERNGLSALRDSLENNNYTLRDIVLTRDQVPEACNVIVVPGPHRDLDAGESKLLKDFFEKGNAVFYLLDPMDTGAGHSFLNFMKQFGVIVGEDVVVDKMSKLVGGDFLMPVVNQYVAAHPITAKFDKPTFFPVVRSVQPSIETPADLEVVPLAMTSSGSWAESNLPELEKGEAAFESEADLAGPISIAVAIEQKKTGNDKPGRMVVIGDSDFVMNGYLGLSGNNDFFHSTVRWLTGDERFINIKARQPEFKPLFFTTGQRFTLFAVLLGLMPGSVLVLGSLWLLWRKRLA